MKVIVRSRARVKAALESRSPFTALSDLFLPVVALPLPPSLSLPSLSHSLSNKTHHFTHFMPLLTPSLPFPSPSDKPSTLAHTHTHTLTRAFFFSVPLYSRSFLIPRFFSSFLVGACQTTPATKTFGQNSSPGACWSAALSNSPREASAAAANQSNRGLRLNPGNRSSLLIHNPVAW